MRPQSSGAELRYSETPAKLEILNSQLSDCCLKDPWFDNDVKLAQVGSFPRGGAQLCVAFPLQIVSTILQEQWIFKNAQHMLFSLSLVYIQVCVYTQLHRSGEKVLSADMLRQIEYLNKMLLHFINPCMQWLFCYAGTLLCQ